MYSVEEKILNYVSRETYSKFQVYKELVIEWNRNTSLVQHDTLKYFMERHILDSLQLLPYIDQTRFSIDIGTGAGFPGMVLAIAGVANIALCDSKQRKIIFLNELKRRLGINVDVICARVENLIVNSYDQVVSRACAELCTLLAQTLIVSRETKKPPILFCLKGKSVDQEIERAKKKFSFNYEKTDSVTCSDGVVLKVTDILSLS